MTNKNEITIAAVGDIHVGKSSLISHTELFRQASEIADVLILCGDLTQSGLVKEAEQLADELSVCKIPKLAVLGNHDYHKGMQEEICKVLSKNSVFMLEDEEYEIKDVGFTGIKGFGGGFGKHTLGIFGEEEMKLFARIAIDEAEKLEINLENISNKSKKVVVMHYSPIVDTIINESPEIFPFLGNSRFEDVIDRFDVSVVLHGHAHFGSLEGKTIKGISVYNVALPLLQANNFSPTLRIVSV